MTGPALAVILLAGTPAAAQPDVSTATPKARWEMRASSLLYFDAQGDLAGEIGLGSWETPRGRSHTVRKVRGGVSPGGRYAWSLKEFSTWNSQKTRRISKESRLTFLGSRGKALWSVRGARAPERGDPIVFSGDGETLLLSRRTPKGYFCHVRTPLGQDIFKAGPFPELVSMTLTPLARFAFIRWADPEKSATHTIIRIKTQARRDIPSSEFALGGVRVTDEGRVFSGEDLVLDFSVPSETETGGPPK